MTGGRRPRRLATTTLAEPTADLVLATTAIAEPTAATLAHRHRQPSPSPPPPVAAAALALYPPLPSP